MSKPKKNSRPFKRSTRSSATLKSKLCVTSLLFYLYTNNRPKRYNTVSCRRKVYDQTGSIEDTEDFSGEQFDELYKFYKAMHAPVTEEAIDDFASNYKGSDEEYQDLLKYYSQFKGNMEQVFMWVMLSNPDIDSHRFMDILDAAIKETKIEKYPGYTRWAKKTGKKPRPETLLPTKKSKKGLKKASSSAKSDGDHAALQALIAKRRQGSNGVFSTMLDSLAGKYGIAAENLPPEPTDEEFEAARNKLEQRKRGGSETGGNSKSVSRKKGKKSNS